MKAIELIFLFLLILDINADSVSIDISSELGTTDYYTVDGNTITLTKEEEYILAGTGSDKNIIVSTSCSLTLSSLTLSSTSAPIIINEGYDISLILSGVSTLIDSSENDKEGVIYLNSGAKLTISGDGTLNIQPNKYMAINGTSSTSLVVNGGTINIQSTASTVGGIYLRSGIVFNSGTFNYEATSGTHHAMDTEGSITIKEGTYSIKSGSGKGIQAEKNLYIGEDNGESDNLQITIITSDEGIEAKGIEIYSGNIVIEAGGDGINAAGDCISDCSGNCDCYAKFVGGNVNINSNEDGIDSNGDIFMTGGQIIVLGASSGDDQPIDQDGILSISGATVLAGGTSSMGGVQAKTEQTASVYVKHVDSGSSLKIYDNDKNVIISVTTPKDVEYLYFSYPGESFTMEVNENEVETSDPSTVNNQGGPGGFGGPDGGPMGLNNSNETNSSDISQILRLSYFIFYLGFILFL